LPPEPLPTGPLLLPPTTTLPKGILRHTPKYSVETTNNKGTSNLDPITNDAPESPSPPPTMLPSSSNEMEVAVYDSVVEKPRRRSVANGTNRTSTLLKNSSSVSSVAASERAVEGYVPRLQQAHVVPSRTPAKAAVPTGTDQAKMQSPTSSSRNSTKSSGGGGGTTNSIPSSPTATNSSSKDTPQDDDDDEDNHNPLIFNSLSDLMAAAGMLPDNSESLSCTEPPVMMEADLAFSCVDANEFAKEQEAIFRGQHCIFDEDGGDDESTSARRSDNDDDDDDDELWDVLGLGGSVESEDEEPARPPRAFLQLWTAIAQWVTPEAAAFVQSLRSVPVANGSPKLEAAAAMRIGSVVRDQSDIEKSRCAGLMAALRLHTARCWSLLNGRSEDLRTAETTLGDLLRCFDYRRPMPAILDLALTRALACVLLHTVAPAVDQLSDQDTSSLHHVERLVLPKPCAALGMTDVEYNYLVRSAIVKFAVGQAPAS
jgi:hypothetical protein